jgi:hypothetical protein
VTQCTATFESGTNGNTIATGDTAAATAWDGVTIAGSGSVTYTNSVTAVGTLAGKVSTTSSGHSYLEWSTALGTVTNQYGRMYIRSNVVNSLWVIMSVWNGSTLGSYIYIDGTGHIKMEQDITGGAIGFTNAISANTWYRLEYHIIHSTTVGDTEMKLFSSLESSTPLETVTNSGNRNTLVQATKIRMGVGCGVVAYANRDLYLDNVVAGAASYPGPSAVAATSLLYSPRPTLTRL